MMNLKYVEHISSFKMGFDYSGIVILTVFGVMDVFSVMDVINPWHLLFIHAPNLVKNIMI